MLNIKSMKSFTTPSLFALAVVALLSSCSRPYATFQKTTPERFTANQTVTAPIMAEPAVTIPAPEATVEAVTPATRPATVNEALDQLEAVASAKAGPSETQKIQKRIARLRTMMILAEGKSSPSTATAAPKLNLMQKLVMKTIDKKIRHEMAPKKPQAATSILTIGAVLVIVGLVLFIAGGNNGIASGVLVAGAIVLLIGLL